MPPSVTNPTELRLFSISRPVTSPWNPPTPAPPGPAPGVEAVMSSALTPFIVTAVANGGLAANVLLEVDVHQLGSPCGRTRGLQIITGIQGVVASPSRRDERQRI